LQSEREPSATVLRLADDAATLMSISATKDALVVDKIGENYVVVLIVAPG
jgi:hypothetical protein